MQVFWQNGKVNGFFPHRFNQCAHQKIHHINQSDYDDFVSTICSARNAFCLTPGGLVQFQELLQSLRRSKSCRKDLWTRILHALATGNVWYPSGLVIILIYWKKKWIKNQELSIDFYYFWLSKSIRKCWKKIKYIYIYDYELVFYEFYYLPFQSHTLYLTMFYICLLNVYSFRLLQVFFFFLVGNK